MTVKVALCIPSMGFFDDHMGISLAALCIESTRAGIELDLACLRFASPAMNRNRIVEKALADGAEYLLWIDTDMVFPPSALTQLLAHKVDIVGCTYGTRDEPHMILGRLALLPESSPLGWQGLTEFEYMPSGFMLVRAEVYRKIVEYQTAKNVWYEETLYPHEISEDTNFCFSVRKIGLKIWCDLALSRGIGHVGKQVVRIGI